VRAAQLDILRNIAAHCDGIRCDMAMLLLNDIFAKVWGPSIAALLSRKKNSGQKHTQPFPI